MATQLAMQLRNPEEVHQTTIAVQNESAEEQMEVRCL